MAALGPSDLPAVFECLRSALSHDPTTQKQAETTLRELESRPGFCSCLAEILASKDADHSARWLAAVHFKNSCNKYWRSRLPGSLSEEEKAHLRGRLLDLVEQPDQQIAVQVAVVFSKVARFDFPRAWPDLFSDLLARLQGGANSSSPLAQRRVYLVLHHILKELASKRLAADQRNFEAVTALLLEPTWARWATDTAAVAGALPEALAAAPPPLQASQQLLVTFERWLLQLKALRRMVVFGFPADARSLQQVAAVGQTAPALLQTLQQFVAARAAHGVGGQRSQVRAMLDRAILKLLKTLRQIQETHPWSFFHCGMLVPCLEFCGSQVLDWQPGGGLGSAAGGQAPQQFVVQSLLFIHGVVRCPSYRGAASSLSLHSGARTQIEQLKGLAAEVQPALAAFWSAPRLQAFVVAAVERLLPLTDKELEEWDDSPESFHHELENIAWEESLRGCTENTFLALFEGNREAVAPVVVELLKRASEACPPGGAAALAGMGGAVRGVPAAVLAKEATYQAVSVGAYELHDYVDFTGFLHGSLLPEMGDRCPAARPLRLRAIKLVSYWTAKLKKEDRPPVYRALVAALGEEDAALQLAAVATLRALVDDWEFEEDQFLEFVAPCFQQLAALLSGASEFDSQLAAFSLLDLVVDRLADGVRPYAPGLLSLLPSVWQQAEGQSLLRIQVLVTLQRLVHALGAESPATYPLLLPVLRLCTDPGQPDELNLLEDGLQLWLVALRHAPAPHPGLLTAVFPNLVAAMAKSTEHIAVGMRIALSCVLLGRGDFLAAQGGGLVQILCGFVGNVKDRGMLALVPVMDAIVQCFPSEGPQLLAPALQCLLADLLAGRESGLVVAAALRVYARLLLQNGAAFLQLFQQAAPHVAAPADAPPAADPAARLLLALVDLWLDKFDSIGQPGARKLSALALCVLLTAPLPALLERLELIVTHITSVWFEVEGSDLAASLPIAYELLTSSSLREEDSGAVVPSEEAEGECSRRKALVDADPVATLRLSAFAKQQLEVAAGVHGGGLTAALNAMDCTLAGQLKAMLDSVAN